PHSNNFPRSSIGEITDFFFKNTTLRFIPSDMPAKSPASRAPNRDVALLIDTSTRWARHIILGINRYKSEMRTPWNLLVEPHGSNETISLPHGWRGAGVIAAIHTAESAGELHRSGLPVVNVSDVHYPPTPRTPAFPRVCTDRR